MYHQVLRAVYMHIRCQTRAPAIAGWQSRLPAAEELYALPRNKRPVRGGCTRQCIPPGGGPVYVQPNVPLKPGLRRCSTLTSLTIWHGVVTE